MNTPEITGRMTDKEKTKRTSQESDLSSQQSDDVQHALGPTGIDHPVDQRSGAATRGTGAVFRSSNRVSADAEIGLLPYRQTIGFGQSVLDIRVLDYTTLCKRGVDLAVSLATSNPDQPKHIMVDSTG